MTNREISHEEAEESAQRLINSHWKEGITARVSIPANPDYDDDIILMSYIQQRKLTFLNKLRAASIKRDIEMNGTGKFSLSFRGNELAGEVGEACNILKKLDREKMNIVGSRATPDQLEDELADIIICVDLIAMEFNIDLESVTRRKFNKTSEQRNLKTSL